MSFSLVETVVNVIVTILTAGGLAGLFALMTVESFGVPPLPSEIILPFAGFLIATGAFPLGPTIAVALGGALVGAYLAYSVGRWWRHHLMRLRIGPLGLEERHLERMDRWFSAHGEVTVALCRSLPVVRAYISYPAGTARMPPVRFGAYTLAGSIPWTVALLYAGIVLGERWTVVQTYLAPLDYLVYALLVAGAVYLLIFYLRARRAGLKAPPRRPPEPEPSSPTDPASPPV
ncbi:MAG TPA: DedA family protein [Thermoplasmata archaeon]|nr:DedA family protein [Thermoplasmata archaeon]